MLKIRKWDFPWDQHVATLLVHELALALALELALVWAQAWGQRVVAS